MYGKKNLPEIQGKYEIKNYNYNITIDHKYYKIESNTTQKLIKQENLDYTGNVLSAKIKLKKNLNFFDRSVFGDVTYYEIHFDNNSENIELKGRKNMVKNWNKGLLYYSENTDPSPKIKIRKIYYNKIKN